MHMRFAVAALLLVADASARASTCPSGYKPPARVLTPAGATIGSGGGIVVANGPGSDDDELTTSWRVRAGSRVITPGVRTIAPGLEVYDVGTASGALVLEDDQRQELVQVTRAKLGASLPAPKPKRIMRRSSMLYVELDGKPPDGALAFVVFSESSAARSWNQVTGTSTYLLIYDLPCNPWLGVSTIVDSVRVAWLDSSGRLSKLSPPIRLAAR